MNEFDPVGRLGPKAIHEAKRRREESLRPNSARPAVLEPIKRSSVSLEEDEPMSTAISQIQLSNNHENLLFNQINSWLNTNAPHLIKEWLDENALSYLKSAHSSPAQFLRRNETNSLSGPLSQASIIENQEDGFDHPSELDPRAVLASKYKQQFSESPSLNQRRLGIQSSPNSSPALPKRITARSNRGSIGGPDCLLVEDVRVSQRIAHAALTRAHYKVEVASDGESAVEKYKQFCGSLRVVLMDIHMPGISGIEATERIREFERQNNLPQCLVFGLTGNVDEANLLLYQNAGMNGCIVKGKLLVEVVKEAVSLAQREGPDKFVNLCSTTGDAITSQILHKPSSVSSSIIVSESDQTDAMRDSPIRVPNPPKKHEEEMNDSIFEQFIPGQFNGPDLLLVEDVRVSQRVASQALARAHYKVDVASDGESAVEKYKSNLGSLRIILMDVGLPGISGVEATEMIRKFEQQTNQKPVWIFGLTGNVDEENLREYQQVGMNGCILKGKLLVEAVKEAVMQIQRNPTQFINLASSNFNTPVQQTRSSISQPELQVLSSIPSALRQEPTDAIATPRAFQPRQLLNAKFVGRGIVKPRIGLPNAIMNEQLAQNDERPMVHSGQPSCPELLLVEDVRVSQKLAQQALTRAHYKVDVASDGELAVEKYKQFSHSIRIILMDVGLPGISGIEATERIRHLQSTQVPDSTLYIFGLTGNVNESNLREYEKAGMNGCILKGKLLVDAVKEAVERVQHQPDTFVNITSQQE